ncbi:dihydropteroate synthase [Haematospirillum sp. H1815]|uniref:dihydropteroate synthase n=1 Tax=Haematospirillum sp. H1815 TaxID=2723108 RepID=UPI001FD81050|nr:dihydropteroate synthase [Haematospirillum sp. H1815]
MKVLVMGSLLLADKSPALPRAFCLVPSAVSGSFPLYVIPLGMIPGGAHDSPAWLVIWRDETGIASHTVVSREALVQWACQGGDEILAHTTRRMRFCEGKGPPSFLETILPGGPVVMGIINVTPDSFSDGGDCPDVDAAFARGIAMLEAGAGILDVGGESTRPGAVPVCHDEEIRRVVPVIRALANAGAVVSVDTRHAPVMEAAVAAGASIINDVSALSGPGSLDMAARLGKPVILMHMQGEPGTMQQAPSYMCSALDVFDALEERIQACRRVGIDQRNICVDPGIGFGKLASHNADILGHLGLYRGLGCPVALGVSRKSFIGQVADVADPLQRLPGSLALATLGWEQGINIVRVHDVAATAQARNVWQAVRFAAQ